MRDFKAGMSQCETVVKSIGTTEEMAKLRNDVNKCRRMVQDFQSHQTVIFYSFYKEFNNYISIAW